MIPLPLDELLEGSAPVLGRVLSTGTLADGCVTQASGCDLEPHVSTTVARQLHRDYEASARDALHCKICEDWLRNPVTLRCGHSICSAHARDGHAHCPTCGLTDRIPCRDFFLQACVEHFVADASKRLKTAKSALKKTRSNRSAQRVNNSRSSQRSSSVAGGNMACEIGGSPDGVHCSICLETFPGPNRAPAILRCGHALCKTCVSRMQARVQVGRRCPLCKAGIADGARPSHALRSALRFYNALPLVQHAQNLRQSKEDLYACHQRVKQHRINSAVAQASLMHNAIRQGDDVVLGVLLEQGTDCNTLVLGFSALHVAIQNGRFDIVQCLLQHGADPTIPSAVSLETPILLASASDHGAIKSNPARLEASRVMLEAAVSDKARRAAHAPNASGSTPLLHVCRRLLQSEGGFLCGDSFEQELELAQLLIRFGADVHAANVFGETPAALLQQLSKKDEVLPKLQLL